MSRVNAIVLGIGLAVLWIVGLALNATPWLTWLNGVAALCSFGIAALVAPDTPAARQSVPPILAALGLFAMWIIGLATRSTEWLVWLTFVAGCAYVLDAVAIVGQEREPTMHEV